MFVWATLTCSLSVATVDGMVRSARYSVPHSGGVRNVEYLLLAVMRELSTVRSDRVLGLWLQVHGRRASTESCRGGAVADGPCGGRR
jgi:hypothetical protein